MAELGKAWALTTSYDIAFLHLILASLEKAPVEKLPCTALPFRQLPVRKLTHESRRWLSAINILLMAEKCKDDVADESSWRARLGLKLASKQIPKARETLENSGFPSRLLTELSQTQEMVEGKGKHLEEFALPICRLMGEIFAHGAALANRPELLRPLRQLGQSLASVIYIQDAVKDLEQDRKRARFNAVEASLGEDWGEYVRLALQREFQRASDGLRSLGLAADEPTAFQVLRELNPEPETLSVKFPRRKSQRGTCDCLCDPSCCCEVFSGCDCSSCDCSSCVGPCDLCNCTSCPCDACCHCGSSGRTEPMIYANDRVKTPLPEKTMDCPACSGHLVAQKYANVEVDECLDCDGIWLDQGELEQLAALKSPPERLLSPKYPRVRQLRPEGTRPCPRCAQILVGTLVNGVRLDLCSDCQGLWLDQGELNQLLGH